MSTQPATTTIEYVADEAHQGPAIIVHETTGPYHAQDNPGATVSVHLPEDGVTDQMTSAEVAAIVGVDVDAMALVSEGHADCWEIEA